MKLFAVSDIHGATKPIEKAAPLIRESDWVVIAGDITHTKTRWLPIRAALERPLRIHRNRSELCG
jgi:predicted phosphodiesterase